MTMPRTFRSLLRTPTLSLGVIATLAVGIAALATTFGILNAALFRQPPFDDARRIAMLYIERNPEGEAPRRERWSFARIQLLRQQQRSFEHVAYYNPITLNISGGDDPELVRGE